MIAFRTACLQATSKHLLISGKQILIAKLETKQLESLRQVISYRRLGLAQRGRKITTVTGECAVVTLAIASSSLIMKIAICSLMLCATNKFSVKRFETFLTVRQNLSQEAIHMVANLAKINLNFMLFLSVFGTSHKPNSLACQSTLQKRVNNFGWKSTSKYLYVLKSDVSSFVNK